MIGEWVAPRALAKPQLKSLGIGLIMIWVLALSLFNLTAYPAPWFDEGQYLHVPKAIVQYGVYADWSSEGPRYYGPTTAAGPTVLLPIAAMYRLFGTGLLQARLVMVAYLLATIGLCYLVAARIYGRTAGLIATALLLTSRGAATLLWGRQVLGEIPVLMFVLAGIFFWQEALVRRCGRRALAAGVFWGLAMITKNQAIIAFAPAVALLALLDWRFYRNGRWSLRIVPTVVAALLAGAWLVILFTLLGPGNLAENLALTRKAAGGAIIVLTPDATLRALKFLVSPKLYGGLLLPALAYGIWRVWRRRDVEAQREAAVLMIVAVWLLWFGVSLGWPRYAYIGAALGALPVARLLVDAFAWARQRSRIVAAGVVIGTGLLIAVPLAQTTIEMVNPDRSVQRFTDYLNRNVAPDALIETWEPELGGLTDHRYHYPPQALLDVAVRHEWSGTPPARYDLNQLRAPYVVIGPFGAWTGVYPQEQIDRDYAPVFQSGPYTLYRRRS